MRPADHGVRNRTGPRFPLPGPGIEPSFCPIARFPSTPFGIPFRPTGMGVGSTCRNDVSSKGRKKERHPPRPMGATHSSEAEGTRTEGEGKTQGEEWMRKEYQHLLEPSTNDDERKVGVEALWKQVEKRTETEQVDVQNQMREIAWWAMKEMFHIENIHERIQWDAFQKAAWKIRGETGGAMRRILDHCAKQSEPKAKRNQVRQALQISWFMVGTPMERTEKLARQVTEGCFEELERKADPQEGSVDKEPILQWIMEKIPGLCTKADDTFSSIFGFESRPEGLNQELVDEMQLVLLSTHWALAQTLVPDCLYDSHNDGSSLSRLLSKTVGYPGPLFIKVAYVHPDREEGHDLNTVGILVDEEMKNSREAYGGGKCALYSFAPSFHVYRTKPSAHCRIYSYSRPPLRSSGHMKGWEGLGFGGKHPGKHRLTLDKDLDKLTFRHWREDDSYEAGPLFPHQGYRDVEGLVSHVQAFGMGGADSLQRMDAVQRRHAAFIEDRRKIDMKKFAEEWRGGGGDKALLGMMSHPNIARGESAGDLRRAGPAE